MSLNPEVAAMYANIHGAMPAPTAPPCIHSGLDYESGGSHKGALQKTISEVVTRADIRAGQTVLDAGCGYGATAFWITDHVPGVHVIATNIVEDQLRTAQQIAATRPSAQTGLHLSFMDYHEQGLLDGSIDRILFVDSLGHAQDPQKVLGEARRVSAPDARIVISDYFPTDDGDHLFRRQWLNPPVDEVVGMLDQLGFAVTIENMTPRAIRSTEYLSGVIFRRHAQIIPQLTTALEEYVDLPRQMKAGNAGYYFITADVNG